MIKIIKIDAIESTNAFAETLLADRKIDSSTCIITNNQTSGKGMGRNKWHSEPNLNLIFSLVYFPDFLLASNQFALNKTVALAVSDLLKQLLDKENIFIKWPNDIYINDKKGAGILIKTSVQYQTINWAIIGIGININQKSFPEYLPNPGSVIQYKKIEIDLDNTLNIFLAIFEKRYNQLKTGQTSLIDREYLNRLYQLNIASDYIVRGEKIKATIKGVNQFGWLQLLTDKGNTIECEVKQLKFV
ncbi:MAG: biotin--[acetyl-CoA-carboxylase] ligase [Bacteroidota bacterium]